MNTEADTKTVFWRDLPFLQIVSKQSKRKARCGTEPSAFHPISLTRLIRDSINSFKAKHYSKNIAPFSSQPPS